MAQQFGILAYQINSSDIPLGSVPHLYFPSEGVILRDLNLTNPTPTSTGIYCYGIVQVIANGTTYSTTQTAAQLAALANG